MKFTIIEENTVEKLIDEITASEENSIESVPYTERMINKVNQ